MPNVNAFGQHLTQGRGPFNPPKPSELAERDNRIVVLEQQVAGLRNALSASERLRQAGDVETLEALINDAIDVENISVDTEYHDDTLTITIEGINLDDDGYFTAPSREFEVEFNITVRGSMVITAADEETAQDIADGSLADWSCDVENTEPSDQDGITDIRVGAPDLDFQVRDY